MTTGTKSLLFGVHQFAWHPVTVWIAWLRLYREAPSWRVTACIVFHDWGYWGVKEMDGPDGEYHPTLGARIAHRLFDESTSYEWHDFCLHHSRYLSQKLGVEPSKLCWADKFSMLHDWQPFYLFRARLSGELAQYRANADRRGFIPLAAPDRCWHNKLVKLLDEMSREKATLHL